MSQKDVVLNRVDAYLKELEDFTTSSRKFLGEFENLQKLSTLMNIDNLASLLSVDVEKIKYQKDARAAIKKFYNHIALLESSLNGFIQAGEGAKALVEALKESIKDLEV